MRLPSGKNTTDQTEYMCPRIGSPTGFRNSASQIRIFTLDEPETMRFPSSEKATDGTASVYPRGWLSRRLACLHLPETNCLVIRARDYVLTIGRGRNGTDATSVSIQYKWTNCSLKQKLQPLTDERNKYDFSLTICELYYKLLFCLLVFFVATLPKV